MSSEQKGYRNGPTHDEALGIAFISGVIGLVVGLAANGFQQATGIPWKPTGSTGPSVSLLTALKDSLAALQSLFTIGGILAAAYLFFWRRRPYPRLVVTQAIEHHRLTPETVWLRVQVTVENKGERLARLGSSVTKVRQILPLEVNFAPHVIPKNRALHHGCPDITWGKYDECTESHGPLEVEPNETTTFEVDFLLSSNLRLVQVYTFITNPVKTGTGHGWPIDTIYSLEENSTPQERGESSERE